MLVVMNSTYSDDTWITTPEELAALPRLQQVLIRYRGISEGRFSCAAQYAPDLIRMLEATERYVRDIVTH